MLSIHANRAHPPHVTALFRDGAQSFVLFEGATLAELAGCVHVIGKTHDGPPIAVHVQFDTPTEQEHAPAIELNEQLLNMMGQLRHALGRKILLSLSLASDLWTVRLDPSEVENTLINLAVKARPTLQEGGRLYIETRNLHVGVAGAAHGLTVGRYVRVTVTGTGAGASPQPGQTGWQFPHLEQGGLERGGSLSAGNPPLAHAMGLNFYTLSITFDAWVSAAT